MIQAMDLNPAQIVHHWVLGQWDAVLNSEAIWACVHCETCTTRCPQGVDVEGILTRARAEAWSRGTVAPDQPIAGYFASFVENLWMFGRSAELLLTLMGKLKTEAYLQDVPLGLRLLARGRLNPLALPKGGRILRRLYDRARAEEARPS